MEKFDVTIVGAGLAGLHLSQLLAQSGLRVALTDRKRSVDESVHTTGIFVRKTFEDFDLPENCLGPVIRNVRLYSPRLRQLNFASAHDEFRVGRMRLLYDRLLKRCINSGVEWLPDMRYLTHAITFGGTTVTFDSRHGLRRLETRYLVGADGAMSRVAENLNLDRNTEWIVGLEEVYQGINFAGPPRLHCFLDPQLAPGYIAWLVNDGEETHIGVGGYVSRFEPARALSVFRERARRLFEFPAVDPIERRGGRIPVNGILRRIANERGLLIGDAAGAVSPLTAGGLDACLRLSSVAASVIHAYLGTADVRILNSYSGERFRARFISRLWMRRIISLAQWPCAMEIGCALFHLPIFNSMARHVFFGRGSFPEVEIDKALHPALAP